MILYTLREMVKEILNNTNRDPSYVRVGDQLYDVISKQLFGERRSGGKFNFDSIDIVLDASLGPSDMVMADKYTPILVDTESMAKEIASLKTQISFLEERMRDIRELTYE